MASKFVVLRLGGKLIKEIDAIVKAETFESRTEFIREILRKEIELRKKEQRFDSLRKHLGDKRRLAAKGQPSEEFDEMRDELWQQLQEESKRKAFPAGIS